MKINRRAFARILTPVLVSLSLVQAGQARQSPKQSATAATHAPAAGPREVSVVVLDGKGNPVRGLRREAFTLFDGKERREIVSFAEADAPATVGVVLDVSGSMNPPRKRRHIREALLRFFADCNAADEFFLIAFNQGVQLLLDTTSDPAAVIAALDRYGAADTAGQTAFYDALYLGLNRAARGRRARRALLVVTDGQDNASRYRFGEVKRALGESDVIVYAVAAGFTGDDTAMLAYGGRETLTHLTRYSGGAAFFAENEKGLHNAMAQAAAEIRARYTLGFVPAPKARDDGWHELKLKLAEVRDGRGKKVETFLRARQGFYDTAAARR